MTDPKGARDAWTSGAEWSRRGWRIHLGAGEELVDVATIPELAAESARRVPDRVAVSVDGEPVSHGQLDAEAREAAAWLAARLARGERMLLTAGTSLGFLRWYLGALRAGVIVVLANPGCTAAELDHLVADSGARLAVADSGPAQRLAGLAIVAVGDSPRPLPLDTPRAPPSADDIALLAYTSGTTGRPKGVPLTHRQLAASIQGAMAAWRWTADDVLVHALPLFHQHGLGGVHATLIAGSTAHLRSRFDPADLIATVRAEGGTVLFGVPASYQALLDWAARPPVHGAQLPERPLPGAPLLHGLRLAVCGSAPLSPALAARLPRLLGQLPLIRYGTTETGLDVSNPLGASRPDTVGLPLPGVECRIWSPGKETAGARRHPARTARSSCAARKCSPAYWRDPGATAAAFTPDGWFRTGDIGAVDPTTGHLAIRGRIKELIISGGLNVYPREVEIALERHPSVGEAAVAGQPHPRWGEQVTAWVVPRPGAVVSEAELVAHARTLLAAYKCPKQVFAVAALPRNQLGKLNRAALTAAPGHPPDHPDL